MSIMKASELKQDDQFEFYDGNSFTVTVTEVPHDGDSNHSVILDHKKDQSVPVLLVPVGCLSFMTS
jgi:hypothetical protein